jgi:hypothetical protein
MKEAGYVYILTNPSFKEDWVKIGKSSRPVDIRSKELDNTAVPLPFEIYATLKTVKYNEVELQLHRMIDRLTDIRIRPNREFFNIAPDKALELLSIISTTLDDAEIIEYENNKPLNPDTNVTVIENSGKTKLTNTELIQFDFWTKFNENAYRNHSFSKIFNLRKPYPQHWYDLSVGSSSYHLCLTVSRQRNEMTAGLYFSDDKDAYSKFYNSAELIEKYIGYKIEWRNNPNKKAARLLIHQSIDIDNKEKWIEALEWLYDICIKIYEITKIYNK